MCMESKRCVHLSKKRIKTFSRNLVFMIALLYWITFVHLFWSLYVIMFFLLSILITPFILVRNQERKKYRTLVKITELVLMISNCSF